MLSDPFNEAFDNVDLVGFAIRRAERRQFHVGILYKLPGKPVHLRHQCTHNILVDTEPQEFAYLWTNIAALKSVNKRLLANKLYKAGGDKIPYGVGYQIDREYLDKKTLKYKVTEPGQGLTCATYVMAVLEAMGFKPFDLKDWQPVASDAEWQRNMIDDLAKKNADDADHFLAEQANIGQWRFRPEHVAGSGNPSTWPIAQAQANELGAQVVASYDEKRPPQLPGLPGR